MKAKLGRVAAVLAVAAALLVGGGVVDVPGAAAGTDVDNGRMARAR